MDFYGGCLFCDKAVDCQIAGEPADDCPVMALRKAQEEFKKAMMDTKLFKVMERIVDQLATLLDGLVK